MLLKTVSMSSQVLIHRLKALEVAEAKLQCYGSFIYSTSMIWGLILQGVEISFVSDFKDCKLW